MQIDGRKINQEIGEKLKQAISSKDTKPSLGILCVGNDRASLSFIGVKKRFGEKYGFTVNILNFTPDPQGSGVGQVKEIKDNLIKLQSENHGVILQLPLPEKFKDNTQEILQVLQQEKDVDDLNIGDFEAPIVLALQKVLEVVGDVKNLKFGVVGLGQVVGMPIKNYLESNGFNLEIIKRGEFGKIKNCDVVISGVGSPNLIANEFIKQGSILIDYGCSYVDGVPYGDFDKSCYKQACFYTPVPGCMGPLVVASLFENTLLAYTRNHNGDKKD